MSKYVTEVNGKEFEELLGSGETVVCDFWAAWCMPCRMLAPVLDSVAAELKDRARFIKINIDENGEIADRYSVMSIPYIAVFEGGELKTQSVGYLPEDELKAFLQRNI